MARPSRCHSSGRECRPRWALASLTALVLLAGCATAPVATKKPEVVPSHVYAQPLDAVLLETQNLLVKNGWHVQRSGDTLVTDWRSAGDSAAITYRVSGQRVDAGYCSVRMERVLATHNVIWTEARLVGHHQGPASPSEVAAAHGLFNPYNEMPEAFEEDTPNENAGGTAVPYGLTVSHVGRDKALEAALEQQLALPGAPADAPQATPTALTAVEAEIGVAPPPSFPDPALPPSEKQHTAAVAPPSAGKQSLKSLAGIWDGSFSFRGNVTGSYTGEVTVAVEGSSAEVSDFCPQRGGPLDATDFGDGASWQGHLSCPPISLAGCAAATLSYDFATATVEGGTLRVVASGTVDTSAACGQSGPIAVTFVAQKADYAHIAVTRTAGRTSCVWPKDWEDLGSAGSMAMPEASPEASAYLGIIRVKGSRLADIQQLLRHCRHLVLLHGEAVSMHLAVTQSR